MSEETIEETSGVKRHKPLDITSSPSSPRPNNTASTQQVRDATPPPTANPSNSCSRICARNRHRPFSFPWPAMSSNMHRSSPAWCGSFPASPPSPCSPPPNSAPPMRSSPSDSTAHAHSSICVNPPDGGICAPSSLARDQKRSNNRRYTPSALIWSMHEANVSAFSRCSFASHRRSPRSGNSPRRSAFPPPPS